MPRITAGSISPQVLAEIEQTLREIATEGWSPERIQIEVRYLLRLIEEKRA